MRLSTLLLLGAIAMMAGAIGWTQHCRTQAEYRLRVLAARLEPLGRLDYQGLQAWPWGRGSLTGLQLRLSPIAARPLGLPVGERLRIERVEVLDYREQPSGTPESLNLRWTGLHWPLPGADRPELARGLAPLQELGLRELRVDGALEFRYLASDRSLRLDLDLRLPTLAAADLGLSLRGGPELFEGRFGQLELSRMRLDYRDQGLLARLRQSPTLRTGIDDLAPEHGLQSRFDRVTAGWNWTTGDRERLQRFLREPLALKLELDPPGQLELRNLRLYDPADLPAVLGLSVPDSP